MTITRISLLALSATLLATPRAAHATSCPPASLSICDAEEQEPLYTQAREALNAGDYRKAERLFADFISRYPKSANVGDAYYYRAFSLFSLGGEGNLREALSALGTQKSKFPKAKTIDDAGPLTTRIRGRLAQLGDAQSAERISSTAQASSDCRGEKEDDIRSEALNALLQMDSRSAIPILKEILQKKDACSAWMRKKAVFLVSQHPSSETENILMEAARNDPSAAVRQDAVFWMGQVHSERAESILIELATKARDMDMRKKALFAITQQQMPRGLALIRQLAEDNGTPDEVRKDAIWQLGQRRSQENSDALKSIFTKTKSDDDVAKSVLFSLSQMRGFGNDRWLLNLATDRSLSEDVRKHAVWCAGQAGIPGSELIALYDRVNDRPVKEHLIWVMSDARDRGALDKLIDIAKNDKDTEMRKKALFWLGQKNDPRVRQLLIDIIKGE